MAPIIFNALAIIGGATLVSAGFSKFCPDFPLSCHNTTVQQNLCCFNSPGGQLLQTQFWDTNPAAGPANSWTIHGLWPDHCDGSYDQYCDESRQYTNITQILESFGRYDMLNYMAKYWKDYHGADETFWEHEFGKHATCISTFNPSCYNNYKPQQEVVDFFAKTIELFKSLNSYQFLAVAGIVPSNTTTYTSAQIQNALGRPRFGVNASIQCSGKNKDELDEIYYHFNVLGSAQDGIYIPVQPSGQASNCPPTGVKYLPKNLTSTSPQQGSY